MPVVFKDVLDNIDDLCQNYNVTNIDNGNKVRQANRAIEYMQRRLGLPSDKKTFSFYYYEDTPFYDCPTGFNEFIQLYYDDSNLNKPANRWQAMKDTEINNNTSGYQCRNKVAPTFINSKNEMLQ